MPRKGRKRPTVAEQRAPLGGALKTKTPEHSTGGDPGGGSATASIRATARRGKGRLEEDEQKFRVPRRKRNFMVPLPDGTQVDIREVDALMADFRLLQRTEPQNFQALLALAQGQTEQVSPESVKDLKEWRFLSSAGLMKQTVRNILLLAGSELEDPCRTEDIKNKLTVALGREEVEDLFRERMKKLLSPSEGKHKGRSP